MNILVFSWRDPKHPLAGGAEQVMHEHMKRWIAAGHEVTLFTSRFKQARRNDILDEVKIIRRGIQYWGVHILGALYYLFGKHPKFDLVVDQFHGIPFFTPLYVRSQKLAVLQEVAGKVWLHNDLPKPLDRIIGWIGYLGEPLLFLPYRKTRFMVGSQSAKNDLVKMKIPRGKVTVVPHGTLISKPKPLPKKEKKKTIIFLGALAKDKGIEDAIKCFSILNKKGRYQFWVVGRGSPRYLKALKEMSKDLGVENIVFHGFVSQKKKFELLATAHVLINPSLLEGFGLVNVEANAVGTPVVGYTSQGLIDSIHDKKSGILVNSNTPEQLANEVFKLLNNPAKLKALQTGAVEWSKNFTWRKSGKLSLELIESLAGQS